MSAAQKDTVRVGRRKKVEKGVEALVLVLKAVKSTSDAFEFPIGPIIDGLLKLCQVFLTMCQNEDAVLELKGHVERLHETLFPPIGQDRQPVVVSDGLKRRLRTLEEAMYKVSEDVTKIPSQSLLKRLTNASDSADKIQKCIRRLSWALKNFLAGCSVDIYLGVEGLHEITSAGFRDLADQIYDITNKVDQLALTSNTSILGGLPYVIEARFDYHNISHSLCDPDTRQEALSSVYNWLAPRSDRTKELEAASPDATSPTRPVFWINGVAGTGKSTLAKTIAHWCEERGILAATFFCSRDGNRSNVQAIFTTIAYQLALLFQPFMECLVAALRTNPHIHAVYAWQQLRKLIIDPLQATRGLINFDQYAIVIDALDECKDTSAVSVILQALATHVLELHPLKFIITSRPDPHITAGFSLVNIAEKTHTLYLDDMPEELAARDIVRYLWNQFLRIRERFDLPKSWPSQREVETLSRLSGHLFIFAAMAVKFVADDIACDPQQQLSTLLGTSQARDSSSSAASPLSPYVRLDALYRQVLQSAFPGATFSQLTKVRLLLGTIVLAPEKLSVRTYRGLLNDSSGAIRILIQKLHSIIVRPANELDILRFVHLSFADFIVDSSRCTLPEFLVQPGAQHSVLARCCLLSMSGSLKYNICAVEDESLWNSEIPDLRECVSRSVSSHLQYSCRYWSHHICRCDIDEELYDLVLTFCQDYLLHWLSALSLMGAIDVALDALTSALDAVQSLPFHDNIAATLLQECAQVVRAFLPAIVASWSEVYRCTLSFLPQQSTFRVQYLSQHTLVRTKMEVLRSLEKDWDLNTLTMDTLADRVPAVCFSPHGRWVVSADDRGGVTIWGSQSGVQVRALEEPKIRWEYVIMSPDNQRILAAGRFSAATYSDGGSFSLQEWDAVTGTRITSWTTTYQQRPIVYSPDGRYRAATWHDGTIALWDAGVPAIENASPLASLRQTETVTSAFPSGVTFSRDGSLLFSVSPGFADLSVWNVEGRVLQRSIRGQYRKHSVSISHTDELIACGCEDLTTTVEILNRRTMTCVRTLTNRALWNNNAILSLDFSPDDTLLVAISRHADVSVYDVNSGALLTYILSHQTRPAAVQAVHFSPYDFRYVATGNDQYVRVRDVALPRPEASGLWKLTTSVQSVWSRLQDTVLAGPRTQELDDLERMASRTFAFSPDGSHLATTRLGNVLRVWDVATGKEIQVSDRTYSPSQKWICWSPSGRWLAMGPISRRTSGVYSSGTSGISFWDARKQSWQGPCFGKPEESYLSAIFLHDDKRSDDMAVIAHMRRPDCSTLVVVLPDRKALVSRETLFKEAGGVVEDGMFVLSADSTRVFVVVRLPRGIHHLALVGVPSQQIIQQSVWRGDKVDPHGSLTALVLSPDATMAFLGTSRGKVLIWKYLYLKEGQRDNWTPPTVIDIGDEHPIDHIWCSPIGQGIVTETGLVSLDPSLGSAVQRSEDLPTAYYLAEGWLWQVARGGCQRIGWVPPDFRYTRSGSGQRGMMAVGQGDLAAFLREDGEMVIIKSGLPT